LVLILAALLDEALCIIRRSRLIRCGKLTCYTGEFSGVKYILLLTKPGIPKINRLQTILDTYPIDRVLLTGTCGALSDSIRTGEIISFGKIIRAEAPVTELPGGSPDRVLLSAKSPVITPLHKQQLREQTGADCVGMEAARVVEFLQGRYPLSVVRVVGDSVKDQKYLQREAGFRRFFTERKPGKKLSIAFSAGLHFFQLYNRKRKLQRRILALVKSELGGPSIT